MVVGLWAVGWLWAHSSSLAHIAAFDLENHKRVHIVFIMEKELRLRKVKGEQSRQKPEEDFREGPQLWVPGPLVTSCEGLLARESQILAAVAGVLSEEALGVSGHFHLARGWGFIHLRVLLGWAAVLGVVLPSTSTSCDLPDPCRPAMAVCLGSTSVMSPKAAGLFQSLLFSPFAKNNSKHVCICAYQRTRL